MIVENGATDTKPHNGTADDVYHYQKISFQPPLKRIQRENYVAQSR